tara:strand:+ start:26 stop:535 length:510 start_codon:yes stop_codon:yes gene_type:complete
MVNKYVGAAKFGYEKVVKPAVTAIKKTFTKKSPTITSVKPKVGSLNIRRKTQEDVIKSADKAIQKQNLTKEQGVAVKKTIAPGLKKISKTQDDIDRLEKKLSAKGKEKLKKLREKKMGGGMMGRRFGYKGGKLVGKQSIIAKQAGDPKKIESVDFKVLQAKRKNKKKVV